MTDVDSCYDHFLFYKDERPAQAALVYVREEYDPSAGLCQLEGKGYCCAIVFETSEEFSDDEAMQLVGVTSADEYDLNHEPGEGEEDYEALATLDFIQP